jgi:hypothetical protein
MSDEYSIMSDEYRLNSALMTQRSSLGMAFGVFKRRIT